VVLFQIMSREESSFRTGATRVCGSRDRPVDPLKPGSRAATTPMPWRVPRAMPRRAGAEKRVPVSLIVTDMSPARGCANFLLARRR